MKRSLAFAALCLLGCGSSRFREHPVVWSVDDARSIPEPSEREYLIKPYFADIFVMRRLERALTLPDE
ncbi:MAG: hypothetical protein JNK04_23940, partial [Myxococcales bacterium]|nr:hypothetical protein [Myxococcales bacterium]